MSKHLPSVVWTSRNRFDIPYQAVRTHSKTEIVISIMPGHGENGIGFKLSRLEARMLARRINQCLDATK